MVVLAGRQFASQGLWRVLVQPVVVALLVDLVEDVVLLDFFLLDVVLLADLVDEVDLLDVFEVDIFLLSLDVAMGETDDTDDVLAFIEVELRRVEFAEAAHAVSVIVRVASTTKSGQGCRKRQNLYDSCEIELAYSISAGHISSQSAARAVDGARAGDMICIVAASVSALCSECARASLRDYRGAVKVGQLARLINRNLDDLPTQFRRTLQCRTKSQLSS